MALFGTLSMSLSTTLSIALSMPLSTVEVSFYSSSLNKPVAVVVPPPCERSGLSLERLVIVTLARGSCLLGQNGKLQTWTSKCSNCSKTERRAERVEKRKPRKSRERAEKTERTQGEEGHFSWGKISRNELYQSNLHSLRLQIKRRWPQRATRNKLRLVIGSWQNGAIQWIVFSE